eukprot:6010734-Pleurochrysis_carterae.AAC.1
MEIRYLPRAHAHTGGTSARWGGLRHSADDARRSNGCNRSTKSCRGWRLRVHVRTCVRSRECS